MAAKRLNLCVPVRSALVNSGISTVKVVNAVNAALGALDVKGSDSKTGDGKVSKEGYKVTVTDTTKYAGPKCDPLVFDAWHSAIARAYKVAEFECVDLPTGLTPWLESMKAESPAPEPAKA